MRKNDESYLRHIADHIPKGDVVLFIGAGVTQSAGGPSGANLTNLIKNEFKNINKSLNNFIDVCDDVLETPPYNRIDLEEFIKTKLIKLEPTKNHLLLTEYNWSCIFTSNFDDLIETAYRDPSCKQSCIPIYSDSFEVDLSDRSKKYLFKIMGSITATESETGQMVLSRGDYNRALVRRRQYLELLSDFVKNGMIVFVGYSFNDHLAIDIIDELIHLYGFDRLPWSFALFDKIEMDEKSKRKLEKRKIIALECAFEEFIEYIGKNDIQLRPQKSKAYLIKVDNYLLSIRSDTIKQCSEFFELLDEVKINHDAGIKDDFFKGINRGFRLTQGQWSL